MFHAFLVQYREELISRTRQRAAVRMAPKPTEGELTIGVPLLLDQIISALQLDDERQEISDGGAIYGSHLLKMGITIAQVVHCYGDICQCVLTLATEKEVQIGVEEYRTFNSCLDDAIAGAVTEYLHQRESSMASAGTERLGFLAHEMRNLNNAAMLSFEVIRTGAVGTNGTTGNMLSRSLKSLRDVIDRSMAEVRLEARIYKPERFLLAEFVEELEVAPVLEAKARGLSLSVAKVEYGLTLHTDRHLLFSAVSNLLQNGIKFTRPEGRIWLRVRATTDRIFIEVEDECGGLPEGKSEELFLSFEQRSSNRTGVGLGLSISRRAVEACSGRLSVDNHPGKGCTFVIDLPRPAPG